MGRFNVNDVDNYGNSGNTNFFQLKNDMDTAQVRIMYDHFNDITGYAAHKIKIGDKDRYVNCLRDYNEPLSKCPFCEDGKGQVAKFYLPLYNIKDKQVQIWERGKKFIQQLQSTCARYVHGDEKLVSSIFEIERHGASGDKETFYQTFWIKADDTQLEDLPEIPEVLGTILMDKTADDMRYFLKHDDFPSDSGDEPRRRADAPARRTERRREDEYEDEYEEDLPFADAQPVRRTPSRGRDNF